MGYLFYLFFFFFFVFFFLNAFVICLYADVISVQQEVSAARKSIFGFAEGSKEEESEEGE